MMAVLGVFPGTTEERDALLTVVVRHCDYSAESPTPCAAHTLLLDARILSHLVFVRRCAVIYEAGEFNVARES